MKKDEFFIDKNGEKVSIEGIFSHYDLAMKLLENDKNLQIQFKESKEKDPIDFLVCDKGYMKLTTQAYYKKCVYHSRVISEKQRELIKEYCKNGYDIDDIYILDMQREDGYYR